MYANGIQDKPKENSAERMARYLSDFRVAVEEFQRRKLTGDVVLTVNLKSGSPVHRDVLIRDSAS